MSRAKIKKNQKYRHIVIYGGSFDPIHFGHIEAIKLALRALNPSHLFVTPAFRNPFKQGTSFSTLQRLRWIKRALREYVWDRRVSICLFEIARNAPTPTIYTIRYFQRHYRYERLSFLLGADNVLHLKQWDAYEELERAVDFVFLTREGYVIPKDSRVLELDVPVSSTQIRQGLQREFVPHFIKIK